MSDEVWWASRDTDRDIVEIRDTKPKMVRVDSAVYALGSGLGLLVMTSVREFESLSGATIQPGSVVPIRPLRIERVEVTE